MEKIYIIEEQKMEYEFDEWEGFETFRIVMLSDTPILWKKPNLLKIITALNMKSL